MADAGQLARASLSLVAELADDDPRGQAEPWHWDSDDGPDAESEPRPHRKGRRGLGPGGVSWSVHGRGSRSPPSLPIWAAGTLLVDADVYGGTIAPMLGLLDESSGLLAATRAANQVSSPARAGPAGPGGRPRRCGC